MQTFAIVLLLFVAAGLAFLTWRILHLRKLVATLQRDHAELAAAWNALPPDARALLPQRPGAFISIEILNPMELAAQSSQMAGAIAGVAPGLIRKIVYHRTLANLRQEMPRRGVRAELRAHGLD